MAGDNPFLQYAEVFARAPTFEPWEGLPRTRGPRKPTLAAAMRQAAKAGVTPVAATIKSDGSVRLEFQRDAADHASTQTGEPNEWDKVLQ